ncbi:C-type lectin 37Db-like [Coccinella septempunctata]|uniref:C-type lectin 37Db-like n=1 Tax=Coccinella septempunctata TaxID=41139 RepID=UPI001D095556|nr:C-type lectin 37Db-like [Coccinella septempunctata]
MFKYIIIYFVCLDIFTGSFASISTEKLNTSWSFNKGIRNFENVTMLTLNKNATSNAKGLILFDMVCMPKVDLPNPIELQKSQKPAIPLVDLGGNSYYFGIYFKANIFKAMQFCRHHGMDLLSIESREENTEIMNYIISYFNHIEHFWTSGSDLGEEGQFVWLSTGKPFNYTYWASPQPDNDRNMENCLGFWKIGDKTYIWNDMPCTDNFHFICEKKDCSGFCKN